MTPEDLSSPDPELHDDLGRLASDLAGGPVDLAMLRSKVDRKARVLRVRRSAAAVVAVAAVGLAYPAYASVASHDVSHVRIAPVSPRVTDLLPSATPTAVLSLSPLIISPPPSTAPSTAAGAAAPSTGTTSVGATAKKPPAAPLEVSAHADRTTLYAGESVHFDLSWTDGEGRLAYEETDFGDLGIGASQVRRDQACTSTPGSGSNPQDHTYNKPGVYRFEFTVKTSGCNGDESQTATLTITVLAAPTPTSPSPSPTSSGQSGTAVG